MLESYGTFGFGGEDEGIEAGLVDVGGFCFPPGVLIFSIPLSSFSTWRRTACCGLPYPNALHTSFAQNIGSPSSLSRYRC